MPLEPNQMLAHYRLVEKLGEGGMGVVWGADDTTLGRSVAIKVLPDLFARDRERLARFEREAKLLASLNHDSIAGIYGLEQVGEVRFLVLELVPGETLAEKISRGPLPVEETLEIGRQIAAALEAAHESGVLHRDLKPANVKITPADKVKVLDFGLAKALEHHPDSTDPSLSPTLTQAATGAGTILGTAAYMSPEQARGKAVDKRADIWAFGCVLFECLTGKRAFGGETISDILAAVLRAEPDWTVLPPDLPPAIARLLRRSLVKAPVDRLRDMGEARIALDELHSSRVLGVIPPGVVPPEAAPRRRWFSWRTLLAVGLTALVTTMVVMSIRPTDRTNLRKFLLLGSDQVLDLHVRPNISPGGDRVVYYSDGQLWIRELDRLEPHPIPGSDHAQAPFWSPDGTMVAFYSSRKLWKVPASGGEPTMVADIPDVAGGAAGGAWFSEGSIYFATGFAGLLQVSAQGGDPVPVLETEPDESDFHDVSALPDGKSILFVVHRQAGIDTLAAWDGEERRQLLQLEGMELGSPTYSASGHILYERIGSNPGIWAVPFSLEDLKITGEPFLAVAEGASPRVSRDGTLLYNPGGTSRSRQMYWVDREGNPLGDVGPPRDGLQHPALSPDGRQVAVSIDEGGERDIWVHDLATGTSHRLTFLPGQESTPSWTPDGGQIVFNCTQESPDSICIKAADGAGGTRTLVAGGHEGHVSPDGKLLVYVAGGQGTRFDLWVRALEEDADPSSVLQSPDAEVKPRFSPDGRHLAYSSWAQGNEVFLIQFPQGEGKWQVGAGGTPRWNRAGDELFFVDGSDLLSVSFQTEPSMVLGSPTKLFSAGWFFDGYDVAPDGQRFLLVRNAGDRGAPNLALVENWFTEFAIER